MLNAHDILSSVTDFRGADAIESARGTVWALAALSSLLATSEDDLDAALAADPGRRDLLAAVGLVDAAGAPGPELRAHFDNPARDGLARGLASVIGQAARAADGSTPTWADQSDHVVIAQGEGSARAGRVIPSVVESRYPEVTAALAAGGSVLDVGTGIGGLATALAEGLPRTRVVGIDIAERVLAIARKRTAALPAELAERLDFRHLDVVDVDEPATYTMVWVPVPCLSESVLTAALPRLIAALRPGGLIMAPANTAPTDPVAGAASRWATGLAGGNGETPDEVTARLAAVGVRELAATPSFPGGPMLVTGLAPT